MPVSFGFVCFIISVGIVISIVSVYYY